MSPGRRPPLLVRALLRLFLPEEEREFILGDLEEDSPNSWFREVLGVCGLRIGARTSNRKIHSGKIRKGDGMLRELLSDLRFGARGMIRSPGFTIVALLTMALGIGANTAIFSLVNGVVLRPLPYPESDRIAFLMENNVSQGWASFTISPLNYRDWEERNRSMEVMAAYQRTSVNYTGGGRPQSLMAYHVTENFLEILGGEPSTGRGIRAEDLILEGDAVVVLTHGFWQRGLGGDPEALGQTMVVDGVVHTIVGILPEAWRSFSSSPTDLILPLRTQPQFSTRGNHFLRGLGRLRPDVTLEQARADFSSIQVALAKEYPSSNEGWGAVVRPLKDVMLAGADSQLFIFLASVGLVLLIACANLANMTLARAMTRTRELAIRTAVGAGRGRVVRQLLAESVLLAMVGGIIGVALAYFGLRAFVAGWPGMLPRMQEIEVNATVLSFSLGLSLVAGVLFGLVPALSVGGPNPGDFLRQGSRSVTGGRSRRWMRAGLVVAEVSLAVVLLVGTGLLVRSFSALQSENPGFERDSRLIVETPLPRGKYTEDEEVQAFASAALLRMQALPGVESVALTSLVPLGGSDQIWGFWQEGASSDSNENGSVLFYRISPGYMETMGIPLLDGRGITQDDREDTGPVVVVSQSFAEAQYPGERAIGKRILWGRREGSTPVEIVGVVGDVQHYGLGQTSLPQTYVPFAQAPTRDMSFILKAAVPPLSLVGSVRQAVNAVDPDQPLVGVQPADAMISTSISTPRFRTLLMTGFGLSALLLAVIGLYGVLAYSVSQRSKEIGVRMALGASRGSVLGLIFREGVPPVGIGLGLGLGAAFALSRVLESMLFGVGTRDVVVFSMVPLVLALVSLAAMLLPARKATRVDPVKTLGEE